MKPHALSFLSSPSKWRAFVWAWSMVSTFYAQSPLQWSDPVAISTQTPAFTAPILKMLDDGTLLVLWGSSSNPPAIWAARLENGVFSAPTSVVTELPGPDLFGFSGFDAAVDGQQVYVSFERAQAGIFVARSTNGGQSFETPVLVQAPSSGAVLTLSSVTTSDNGNLYVSYIYDKNLATHQLHRSVDGGLSFSPPVDAGAPSPGDAICECCPSSLFARGDTVWMAYRNNNSDIRDHWISRSTDAGDSFNVATDIDSTDWHLLFCPISGPSMCASGDSLAAAWMSGADGVNRIFVSSIHAGAMGAGNQISFLTTNGPSVVQNQVRITGKGDTLGLVFQEKNSKIVFFHSYSGISDLPGQYSIFEATGHILRYPATLFHDKKFHLVYVDATTHQLVYRSANTNGLSGTDGMDVGKDHNFLYPNPVSDRVITFHTTINLPAKWEIMNTGGEKIGSGEIDSHEANIVLPNCPSGVYFINICNRDTSLDLAFIKQ